MAEWTKRLLRLIRLGSSLGLEIGLLEITPKLTLKYIRGQLRTKDVVRLSLGTPINNLAPWMILPLTVLRTL